jgi:hypothetical protein
MQIRVQLTHEHLAASFWADSPEIRALIQSHFPAFNQSLSEQGFHGHQISMSLATGEFSGQAGQFAQQHAALLPAALKTREGRGVAVALNTERPAQRRWAPRIVDGLFGARQNILPILWPIRCCGRRMRLPRK